MNLKEPQSIEVVKIIETIKKFDINKNKWIIEKKKIQNII